MRNLLIVAALIILAAAVFYKRHDFYTYFNGKPATVDDELLRLNGAL